MNIQRFSFIAGAALSLFAVLIGAFGAHGFEQILIDNNRVDTFETGSLYHLFHALALLIAGVINPPQELKKTLLLAALSLFVGVIIFSGSLYVLALTNISFLGAITPIGGMFFLIGWGFFIKLGLQWSHKG